MYKLFNTRIKCMKLLHKIKKNAEEFYKSVELIKFLRILLRNFNILTT